MTDFASWIVGLIKALFVAVWDFLGDIIVWCLSQILTAITQAFSVIVVPCFMSLSGGNGGLSHYLAQIPSYIWFFASHLNIAGVFSIFSCAIIFVLTRKLITLFQW